MSGLAPGILLLAAGGSTRMGRPKQLLRQAGQSLVRQAAETALVAGANPVVVVLGAFADEVRAEIADLAIDPIINDRWESGIGSSIRVGVHELLNRSQKMEALVIMLCDQPLISAVMIHRLVEAQLEPGKPVCAAAFGDAIGPPVLVTRHFFAALLELPDDRGARHVWAEHPDDVYRVAMPEAGTDIDTPTEYERLMSSARLGSP